MADPRISGGVGKAGRAGVAAALLYFAALAWLGALEPGFSHLTDPMSLLGGVAGPRGLAFNLCLVLTGLLIVWFALWLGQCLRPGGAARGGTILLVLGGVGMIGACVFPCDAGCANVLVERTATGTLHSVFALFAGMGTGLSTLFYWRAMRGRTAWRRLAWGALLAAVLANGAGLLFWVQYAMGWEMPLVEGLAQRAGIVVTMVWILVVGWVMRAEG